VEAGAPRVVLDHTAVEATIMRAGYTGVLCNGGENPAATAGVTFTCVAAAGKVIDVTITSADGRYTWSPSSETTVSALDDLAAKLRCAFVEESDDHELYTSDQGSCGDLILYLFKGEPQRDDWLAAAQATGGNYVVGPTWIVSAREPASARSAQAVVGGELQ
jgi:hypothetical protein